MSTIETTQIHKFDEKFSEMLEHIAAHQLIVHKLHPVDNNRHNESRLCSLAISTTQNNCSKLPFSIVIFLYIKAAEH